MSQYRTCEGGRCVSRGIFRAAPNEPPAASEWAPDGTFPISSPLYIVWVYGTRRDAWRTIPGTAPGAWESLMAAINTSTCLWLHGYVVPQNTTRDLTGLTAVSLGPPLDSRSALVRSCCTCSSASRTRYIFYWWTFLTNQETPRLSIKLGDYPLAPTKLTVWNPGHFFFFSPLHLRILKGSITKQKSATIKTWQTKISCLNKTTFPNQKSPNSREAIKKAFKTASLQFRGGSRPNVVQTAKATKRKPTKTQQLWRAQNSKLMLSGRDNTPVGSVRSNEHSYTTRCQVTQNTSAWAAWNARFCAIVPSTVKMCQWSGEPCLMWRAQNFMGKTKKNLNLLKLPWYFSMFIQMTFLLSSKCT